MDDETRLSIDAIVESYLDARRNRESLTISDLLQRRGAHDRGCLEALVIADARLRLAEDEQLSADDYLRQWPELAGSDCLKQVGQLASHMVGSNHDDLSRSLGPMSDQRGVGDYEVGDRISHFEIIRSIGKGTHGCVYLALDLTLRRTVAFIVSAASGVEGEALARLDHPNVVRVFGGQTIGEHKLLAMQFIPGRTLADFLREKPYQRPGDWDSRCVRRWIEDQIQPGDVNARAEDVGDEHAIRADRYDSLVVHWMIRIARALNHAHLRGVLHRDVKPSNVILLTPAPAN